MSTTAGKNTHPLTAVVKAGENRDPVGHLIEDFRADREFRFVKMRGGQTASMGMPCGAYKLSADEDTLAEVTVDAASMAAFDRDLAGIFVGQSTCASGQFGWIMTRGRMGKIAGSLYPLTIVGNMINAAGLPGHQMHVSTVAAFSTLLFRRSTSAFDGGSIGQSQHARNSLLLYSTDVGNKVTRGKFVSPLFFSGLNLPPNT